jgi:hypothetical protein
VSFSALLYLEWESLVSFCTIIRPWEKERPWIICYIIRHGPPVIHFGEVRLVTSWAGAFGRYACMDFILAPSTLVTDIKRETKVEVGHLCGFLLPL